jgi:hypothetical protein
VKLYAMSRQDASAIAGFGRNGHSLPSPRMHAVSQDPIRLSHLPSA